MKFSELARSFQEIEPVSSRLQITELLSDLFSRASNEELKIAAYLSLGQLNPPYIGTQFQLAKKGVIKIVASVLGVDDGEVKTRLSEWGDLGTVVEQKADTSDANLSVLDVYNWLEKIEKISGTGAQEEKQNELSKLLSKCDSVSAKYIVRIILGTLRLGFSDMTVIDALSWMISGDKSQRKFLEHAYNLSADLGRVAFVAKSEGIDGVKKLGIEVGIPIRPAAAERAVNAKAIIDKMGPCIAQPKLDGFRLQVHIDKTGPTPKVYFFSRNLLDMSNMFPDLVEAALQLDVQTLICEGEGIVFDEHAGNFLPFQETIKRKRKHDIEKYSEEMPLQLQIFDILYLNGEEQLSKTHAQRRVVLEDLFAGAKKNNISVIEERSFEDAQSLENYFLQNIAHGLEGLVVKKPDSIYQPGKRNFNWIKLKRKEEGQLDDTVDCVILGYYHGQGKRAGFGIGAFLIGVYNKDKDHFQTVAKVGTGLKDSQWVDLKKKCDAHKVLEQPKNVECAKDLYPNVWIAPEIVCTVLADEITKSPAHTAGKTDSQLGLALRFPRFIDYRDDKNSTQTTSVLEMQELYDMQFEK